MSGRATKVVSLSLSLSLSLYLSIYLSLTISLSLFRLRLFTICLSPADARYFLSISDLADSEKWSGNKNKFRKSKANGGVLCLTFINGQVTTNKQIFYGLSLQSFKWWRNATLDLVVNVNLHYGISTIVGYLMPNPLYAYTYIKYIWFGLVDFYDIYLCSFFNAKSYLHTHTHTHTHIHTHTHTYIYIHIYIYIYIYINIYIYWICMVCKLILLIIFFKRTEA